MQREEVTFYYLQYSLDYQTRGILGISRLLCVNTEVFIGHEAHKKFDVLLI